MDDSESWSEWSETPRDSEYYKGLAAHLMELKLRATGETAKRMIANGDNSALETLGRIDADEQGQIIMATPSDDPDNSPEPTLRVLNESALSALIDTSSAAIARSERNLNL